jgi:protoporphyrin/coproporphyrin ferrochelatase
MQTGVLLFNLGGPETLQDVRPFLFNLFSDPEIIRIKSNTLRRLLAWTIATARQVKSRNLYRQIGGGSPLRRITEAQAAALRANLNLRGMDTRIYVGMRCWKPSIEEAVEQILRDRITRLILLPLFPQYSVTTTGSCFKHFETLDQKLGISKQMDIACVRNWFDEPLYIESMADLIREGLSLFAGNGGKNVHLLYSAHSIPARYVAEGDPYLEETKQSVALINAKLGIGNTSMLAFQSKVGPVKWLSPSTVDVLNEVGKKHTAKVLVVPVSFVSDHIETLQEIDIQYKELAANAGIKELHRSASLNLYPKFIDALANVVLRAMEHP